MKIKTLMILFTLLMAFSGSAFAGDRVTGNGGVSVETGDGKVVSGDAWAKIEGEDLDLGTRKKLYDALRISDRIFSSYGQQCFNTWEHIWVDRGEWQEKHYITDFFWKHIFDSTLDMRLVKAEKVKLACSKLAMEDVKSGKVKENGCTNEQGTISIFIKEVFEKMSPVEQAKAVIHERMHALVPRVPHEYIASITTGVGILLKMYYKQQKRQKVFLNDRQIKRVERMRKRLVATFGHLDGSCRTFFKEYRVCKNGGGLVYRDCSRFRDSYIGVAVTIPKGSSLGKGTDIVLSQLNASRIITGKNSSIVNSFVEADNKIIMEKDAVIKNSMLKCEYARVNEKSFLIRTRLSGARQIFIKKKASLQSVDLLIPDSTTDINITAGKGTRIKRLRRIVEPLIAGPCLQADLTFEDGLIKDFQEVRSVGHSMMFLRTCSVK